MDFVNIKTYMDETRIPKLPKAPFIVVDVVLVFAAIFIANSGEGPLNPFNFFWIIFCVTLGGVLACLPFYVEFRNHMRLAEYDKSQSNFENSQRIEAAMALMQSAGEGIESQSARAEAVASAIEGLVRRLEERLQVLDQASESGEPSNAEHGAVLAEKLDILSERLESQSETLRVGVVTDVTAKLEMALSELKTALTQLTPETKESTGADVDELFSPIMQRWDMIAEHLEKLTVSGQFVEDHTLPPQKNEPEIEDRSTSPYTEAASADASESIEANEPKTGEQPSEEIEPTFGSADFEIETAEVVDGESDDTADSDGVMAEFGSGQTEDEGSEVEDTELDNNEVSLPVDDWSVEDELDTAENEEPEAEMAPDLQPNLLDEIPQGSQKAKKPGRKETTLIAHVLIGIGNKPYIRAEGPGIESAEGIPMDFLEIGKWQWVAPETDGPIHVRIFKNNEIEAEGGAIELEPGQKRNVSPRFPS